MSSHAFSTHLLTRPRLVSQNSHNILSYVFVGTIRRVQGECLGTESRVYLV